MPHTSRRKKERPNKRVQVEDDDGWTRVTTTHRIPNTTPAQAAYYEELSNGHKRPVDEAGTTVQRKTEQYRKVEEGWLASEACQALQGVIREKLIAERLELNACFVFGTGSFCGVIDGWIARHDVALCQLAVLLSIRRTIEEASGKRIPAYGQEIRYTELDERFLATLDVESIKHPQGFQLITDRSLVYAPGAEQDVTYWILAKSPMVYLTYNLAWYEKERIAGKTTAQKELRKEDTLETLSKSRTQTDEEEHAPSKQRDLDFDSDQRYAIWKDFVSKKQKRALPDYLIKDSHPFYQSYLYWPKDPDEDGQQHDDHDPVHQVTTGIADRL